jgi:hypothetical protein
MAYANFNRKSVKELQKYLKVSATFSDLWKAELVEIWEAADRSSEQHSMLSTYPSSNNPKASIFW